jgi:hypothetical protein
MVLSDQEDSVRWNWTASGEFSTRSAYAVMFIGEAGCTVLKSSGRHGLCWSTSSSCGLRSMRDAGLTIGYIGMDCPMIPLASSAYNTKRSSTTSLLAVCSVARYGRACSISLVGKCWCQRCTTTSRLGGWEWGVVFPNCIGKLTTHWCS